MKISHLPYIFSLVSMNTPAFWLIGAGVFICMIW